MNETIKEEGELSDDEENGRSKIPQQRNYMSKFSFQRHGLNRNCPESHRVNLPNPKHVLPPLMELKTRPFPIHRGRLGTSQGYQTPIIQRPAHFLTQRRGNEPSNRWNLPPPNSYVAGSKYNAKLDSILCIFSVHLTWY